MVAGQRGAHRPGPGDETRALRLIVAKAGPLLATEHVFAARAEGDVFRVVAGSGVAVRLIGVEVPPGLGMLAAPVSSPRAVMTADYARHASAAPAVVKANVRGLAVAPIIVRSELAGCIGAFRLEPRRFSPREQRVLERLAAEAAVAIEPRERHRRRVERIEVISQALFGPYDVAAVLDRIGAMARRLAPAAEILITLIDEAGGREDTIVRYGRHAPRSRPRPRGEPTTFPLRFGDRTLGTLQVASASAEETEALSDVACVLGTAVANARLLQELRAESERTARLAAEGAAMVRDLAASEERLRATYDAMACGVIVRDASGAIVRTNAAVERILGLSGKQLREGGDLAFFHRTTEDGTEIPNGSYPWQVAVRTRQPVRDRTVAVTRPDGERRWLHLDVVPVLDARGAVDQIVSSFIDITDRKRAEEQLEERARQQEAVVELGRLATAVTSFSDLMERAAALVARALDVEYVKVLELLPEGGLALRAGVGWRQGVVGALVLAAERSQGGYALGSGAPVVVDDLATESRFPKPSLLVDHGVTSGVSVVIDAKEGPFGTVGAHTARRRSFGASDVAFLQVIASVLGMAAQRERRRAQRTVLLGRLTPREREVLRLAAQGLNNRDIAARLGIGYATVRRHVRGFIEKLDTRSKLEAAARARSYGLLSDDQIP